MARITSHAGGPPILPRGTGPFFRRRLTEAGGLTLVATGLALFAALVSYAPSDPSINTAGGGGVQNWLGAPGAIVADVLLQGLGLAAALPAVVLAAWGLRLFHARPPGALIWRLGSLLAAMSLLAAGLSVLPRPEFWPFVSPLGGAGGTVARDFLHGAVGMVGQGLADWTLALLCAVLSAALMVFALGLAGTDWAAAVGAVGRGARALVGVARRWAIDLRGTPKVRERREPWLIGDRETSGEPPKVRDPVPSRPGRVAESAPGPRPARKPAAERQGRLDLEEQRGFRPPPAELLDSPAANPTHTQTDRDSLEQNARLLESVLQDFGVRGDIVKVRPGPVVTLYELEPAPGTKSARVIALADDIARSMSALSVRIALIPGRNVIGLELPNAGRDTVHLRELLDSNAFERAAGKLTLALGKDIGGTPVLADLARMPHLLIAGTTGSGKSVGMNAMILTLLYKFAPETCRLIMIDPKMLELSVYEGIPHLLCPVVTEPAKAILALKWAVREMEDRYRAMSQLGVRNIAGYNARIEAALKKGEILTRQVQTGFDSETGRPVIEEQPLHMEPLPFIVVVVDEMADLMLVAGKDIEGAVQRLAQMARAAGIHLIMATQRPSVDVITGTIKANFPTRISFQVTSKIDSRTILGESGAEQLLGQGDMLYMAGGGRITRVHGPFVSDEEVERVVAHLKSTGEPEYLDAVTEETDDADPLTVVPSGDSGDTLFDEAVELVAREGKVSTSFIQRYLQIGYNRAARIVERMEAEGMISKADRVGRREVLVGRGERGE